MSTEAFFTGGAMQCEHCRTNLANFKFADTGVDNGQTKVVCSGCYHLLSLHCIRTDLTNLKASLEAVAKKVGADLG